MRERSRRFGQASQLLPAVLTMILIPLAPPSAALASAYDHTNPKSTVCWNGSHPVQVWRTYFVRTTGNLVIARMDTMYSDYCNTVWTRVENKTGSTPSSTYLNEHALTVHSKITTYNCALQTCHVDDQDEYNDHLPNGGDDAWTEQIDLAGGAVVGGQKQPRTVRSEAWVAVDPSSTAYHGDSGREPTFTLMSNNFSGYWYIRNTPSDNPYYWPSCDNSGSGQMCHYWTSDQVLDVEIQPEFATVHSVNMKSDIANTIIPAWTNAWDSAPDLRTCTFPCTGEEITAKIVVGGTLGGGLVDAWDANNKATHARFEFTDPYPSFIMTHWCGAVDDGCVLSAAPQTPNYEIESRTLLIHEFGHTLGIGHCDLDFSAMCHQTGRLGNDYVEGTAYWTPKQRDVWALKAMYP